MHTVFYLLPCKFPLKSLLSVLFVLIIFSGFRADAQRRRNPGAQYGGGSNGGFSDSGYGISLNTDYDAPLSELGSIYKAAPAFNLNVLLYRGSFTFNTSIGYHAYKPKQAVFYYDDGAGGSGTIAYQNYSVYSIYVGVVYNLPLDDLLRVYAGLNLGAYYTQYAYDAADQFSETNAALREKQVYFAPKFGLTFTFSEHIGAGLEGKYNIFSPEGGSANDPLVGSLYKSYAVGLVLTYKF